MDITKLNYDELRTISKKFQDEADDYAQLLSDTKKKLAGLRGEWEGEAADKFFEEMEHILLPALKRLANGLIFAEDVLNQIVSIIRDADEETVSIFKRGEDFGASGFNSALGAGLAGAGIAGGADFGASLFNQAGGNSPTQGGAGGSTPQGGSAGGAVEGAGSAGGSAASTPAAQATPPAGAPEAETPTPIETPQTAGGGGGGGGGTGAGGSGLQGDLKGMGLGLAGQPAGSSAAGGSSGGAESLPDHIFESGGGGTSGGGGPLPQGGASGGGAAVSSGADSGIAAGVAGAVGSAAIGGAAKVLKDKMNQDE